MTTLARKRGASFEFAEHALTVSQTDFFGLEQINRTHGKRTGDDPEGPIEPILEEVSAIPFPDEDFLGMRQLGHALVYYPEADKAKQPITGKRLYDDRRNVLADGKFLYSIDWYAGEPLYTTLTPRQGWRIVSKEVIPGSTGVNYLEQTDAIADYLPKYMYRGRKLPKQAQTAIEEFKDNRKKLERLMNDNWKQAAEELGNLALNRDYRETPVEILWRLPLHIVVNGERCLHKTYHWSPTRSSGGGLVRVGLCGPDGVRVGGGDPRDSGSGLGVCVSRSSDEES